MHEYNRKKNIKRNNVGAESEWNELSEIIVTRVGTVGYKRIDASAESVEAYRRVNINRNGIIASICC